MFSINSALNRFAILLCCSDDAQTFRIVAYLIEQGAPSNKMDNFIRRKKVVGQKTSKKWVFWDFQTIVHKIASQFYCSAPMMLKLTG